MSKKSTLRYAVIGLGHLTQVAILPAFRHTDECRLVALFSGDKKKQRKLSREYGVPAYDYDELKEGLKREGVDVAYVVVPNTDHRSFTERIAKVGVHVLCEKPMAMTTTDCQAMISVCQKHRVKLMVAYRLHLAPAHLEAIRIAQTRKLGDLRIYQSTFTMQVKSGNIRTKSTRGGGPLFDIGIYSLNAARYLFQDEPISVSAVAASSRDPRFKEIDEMVSAVFRFPGDRLANITCSFGAQDLCELRLIGTQGLLKMDSAFHYVGPNKWTVIRGQRKKVHAFAAHDQFAAEMDYFAKCIRKGVNPEPSGQEGMIDVKILQAVEESARTGRSVDLHVPLKKIRPQKHQKMKRPPVQKKSRLVKASAPHH